VPRPLTTGMTAQITGVALRPCFFLQAHFLSGDIFLWSGLGTVTWNGQVWQGVGSLGQISAIQESANVQANNVTFTLSGIPSDLISKAISETRQGYAVQLWFGALGDNNNVIVDPLKCFAGRMDVPTVEETPDTSSISITVENRLVDLQRSRLRRYTHEDQQIDYPGDLGFVYVSGLQNWNGVWGNQRGTGSGVIPPGDRPPRPSPGGGGGGVGGIGPIQG
jgi:hypothetical protein